jgi:hypothetical protein|tara:strand:+ start:78 stop:356 length:279 start_codon:yes stop_codon:yes gene_type:complete
MGQFDDKVQKQRDLLAAEEWAKGVHHIHSHRLKSMWYETRPQDTDEGNVMDIIFNDGLIERHLPDGGVVFLGKRLKGQDLVDKWSNHDADIR